jgi:transposase
MICSGCGERCHRIHEIMSREVRDLPCFQYRTTVVIEYYRLNCPRCGIKREQMDQLPSKAPFSKRFEDVIGVDCRSAAVRQVAHRHRMAETTARAIDLRFLEREKARRKKVALRQIGVDEIHMGKIKFITVVSNLETGEPLWFGLERKQATLDEFFRTQLSRGQRGRIQSACVDMHAGYSASIRQWCRNCKIVYDKFHIMQHANNAVDEVRRAEFFRQGRQRREVMKGKRWLLLTRWHNLKEDKQRLLNELFKLNRRVMKTYLMKEELERLWTCNSEEEMRAYFRMWCRQLRWQRLKPMEKVANMIVKHMEGIVNYYKVNVRFGVVEAINSNLRALIRRGRGYTNLRYLLLKAQDMAANKIEFVAFRKAA